MQTTSFVDAPPMYLLRHDDPVPEELQDEVGVKVWTRYLVRMRGAQGAIDRVASAWHGPTHEWTELRGTLAWKPWARGMQDRGTLTIVAGPLSGYESAGALRDMARETGGPIT